MEEKKADTPPRMDLSNVRDLPPPEPRPKREIKVKLLPYDQRTGISAHDRLLAAKANRPSAAERIAKGLMALLVVAALLVGLFFLLSAFDSGEPPPAPWSHQNAPIVTPAPLSAQ
ncbi:hypothetical protein NBH00_12675 [Paraconexibacter antarcticus]|uniref:Uncharacterized protein n=1 Tax=Paraconexibacter antarcticus TaxID=2949664 RepID=A0ABY5E2J2_9ACTN|nr:hypothetical protein [Paraconexibacter antarcticus]UTI67032.1 hypothetical protein NBH00_12675 [Paraconexibacter antarcticus]